jgi:SecD/SecF fusion protein
MQNKGFIRVFAVLLTLVCIFYLSFSVVTNRQIKKAEEFAAGDSKKYADYLDSISAEKVYLWYTFKQCQEMGVGLGLDLKGGMTVTLQVSVDEVLRKLSRNNPDENFNLAVEKAVSQRLDGGNFLEIFLEEYQKIDPDIQLASIFANSSNRGLIGPGDSNEKVLSVLEGELDDVVNSTVEVLRKRIDQYGVVSPNIQKIQGSGRILIELPGVKEPERVEKLLQGSANLEFWETYNFDQVSSSLMAAESKLQEMAVVENDSVKATTLFSLLSPSNVPGSPVFGYAHANDKAAVDSMLSLPQVKEMFPADLVLRWSVKPVEENSKYYQLVALKSTPAGKASLGDEDIINNASDDFDRITNQSVVSMSMNEAAAEKWAQITRDNIGRCIAIVLDNQVYSFPVVNTEIKGGNSQISGNFTVDEARDLATVLKSGKMSASVEVKQKAVIGPSLGQEAIDSGIISFIIAIVLLMIYMIVVYGVTPGLVANIALIINLFFTIGILASFQAVLTLSGIAGLVLSLAIAVDANVLIYERAKEELRGGKSLGAAITDGYKNAFSAIFDANITSIITGIILFVFGTGPIKGFATTLIIGIIVSFFTAVFLTRLFYEFALSKNWIKNLTFTTPLTKNLLTNTAYNFLKRRKLSFVTFGVVAVIGVASLYTFGLDKGIDFTGGRNYVIALNEKVNTQEVADLVRAEFSDEETAAVSVITIGGDNQVRISTNYKITDNNPEVETLILDKLYKALQSKLGDVTLEQFKSQETGIIASIEKVDNSIAKEIAYGAIWAVILSLLAIALYVLIRFSDVAFSIGTLVALTFDALFILAFYSIFSGMLPFSMEIDQAFIAAILTVIGYSVNDKVVVFDRIREETGLYPKRDKLSLFNNALNSTLSRTLSTSISTILVLVCMFALGGDTIRSFIFAMTIGVIAGTCSTLFLAVPTAYVVLKKKEKKA